MRAICQFICLTFFVTQAVSMAYRDIELRELPDRVAGLVVTAIIQSIVFGVMAGAGCFSTMIGW